MLSEGPQSKYACSSLRNFNTVKHDSGVGSSSRSLGAVVQASASVQFEFAVLGLLRWCLSGTRQSAAPGPIQGWLIKDNRWNSWTEIVEMRIAILTVPGVFFIRCRAIEGIRL